MTAELDIDLATETELLNWHYQKCIKAGDQVRWSLQAANATEEQIEEDYSTVAEVEEEISMVLTLAKKNATNTNTNWTLSFKTSRKMKIANGIKTGTSCSKICSINNKKRL